MVLVGGGLVTILGVRPCLTVCIATLVSRWNQKDDDAWLLLARDISGLTLFMLDSTPFHISVTHYTSLLPWACKIFFYLHSFGKPHKVHFNINTGFLVMLVGGRKVVPQFSNDLALNFPRFAGFSDNVVPGRCLVKRVEWSTFWQEIQTFSNEGQVNAFVVLGSEGRVHQYSVELKNDKKGCFKAWVQKWKAWCN